MGDTQFVYVDEATVSAILEREDVHPTFLERNDDNTFIATFDKDPAPVMRGKIADADDTIRLLEPEAVEAREPNVEPGIASVVRFGFIEEPTH